MMVEMICAGFGGQGVLTTGLILAEAGMKLGMNVLWYPSYGSEMRGGTANCTVKFSDKEIASPCAKKIDILMGMNAPAIDKFESRQEGWRSGMMVEMICAGFGGQGVLTTGLILAEAGMKLGMNVLWYPSYGSEMRGGTANCTVKFSDKEIASPCAKKIDILMGMNAPAIDKFESSLRPGGLLLVNSSLVHEREYRDDIRVVKVPMTEIAAEHENPKGANIVMMGAMAANSDLFTEDDLERLINEFFEKKGKINPKNSLCFRAGTQIH